jgi:hypothetical protein
MGHYIEPCKCSLKSENELTAYGISLGFDHKVDIKKKFQFPGKGARTEKQGVYGWRNSVLFAQQQPQIAIESPENYSIFAGTMFWSKFWWVSGKAQTAKDLNRWWRFKSGS